MGGKLLLGLPFLGKNFSDISNRFLSIILHLDDKLINYFVFII